jgi:predicted aminopeptidase
MLSAEKRNQAFASEIEQSRARLGVLYRQRVAPEMMRERKRAELAALQAKLAGHTRFKDVTPNNAFLASFATYTELAPTFEHLLQEEGGDLARFYARVRTYAARPPAERGPFSTTAK